MDEYAVPILPSRDLGETLDFYLRLGFENRGAPPELERRRVEQRHERLPAGA